MEFVLAVLALYLMCAYIHAAIGAEVLIERYERGNLTKKELDNTLAVWHNTESRLREKVTTIYDVAYTEKCFDNIGSKERR